MPDDSQAAGSSPSLQRLQDQLDRLARRPSGLVDLGYAITGPVSPAREQECADYKAALPEYIEAEINGEQVRRRFPTVARHLDLCERCATVYVDLLELALASDAAPLPIPATVPAFHLSFLPALKLSEQFRQFMESLTKRILPRWRPEALVDLPIAISAFFQRLERSGTGFLFQPQPARALGLGTQPPLALESVAAAHAATLAIVRAFSQERLAAELSASRPSPELQKLAQSAAHKIGMKGKAARQWAAAYTTEIQAQSADFLALAQKLREENPD